MGRGAGQEAKVGPGVALAGGRGVVGVGLCEEEGEGGGCGAMVFGGASAAKERWGGTGRRELRE